eukprot:740536-Rhodomonas_salina.1
MDDAVLLDLKQSSAKTRAEICCESAALRRFRVAWRVRAFAADFAFALQVRKNGAEALATITPKVTLRLNRHCCHFQRRLQPYLEVDACVRGDFRAILATKLFGTFVQLDACDADISGVRERGTWR